MKIYIVEVDYIGDEWHLNYRPVAAYPIKQWAERRISKIKLEPLVHMEYATYTRLVEVDLILPKVIENILKHLLSIF